MHHTWRTLELEVLVRDYLDVEPDCCNVLQNM